VIRAEHALIDMAYFPASDSKPADFCATKIEGADVYVGIIGLRYGSPVRDRPELSHTELEFEVATDLGLTRLVFLIREDAPALPPVEQPAEHTARLEAFRRRLQESGVTVWIASPADLELRLLHALTELSAASKARGRRARNP
jgi:hypothetical protein